MTTYRLKDDYKVGDSTISLYFSDSSHNTNNIFQSFSQIISDEKGDHVLFDSDSYDVSKGAVFIFNDGVFVCTPSNSNYSNIVVSGGIECWMPNRSSMTVLSNGDHVYAWSTEFVKQILDTKGLNSAFNYEIQTIKIPASAIEQTTSPIINVRSAEPVYGTLSYSPDLQSLPNGGFVIVWEDMFSSGQSTGLYIRTYDSNLNPSSEVVKFSQPPSLPWVYNADAKVNVIDSNHFLVDWNVWTGINSGEWQIDRNKVEVNLLLGTSESEVITGSKESDWLIGWGGNDILFSSGGNDVVDGGDGNDLIIGGDGAGDDIYTGGTGLDTIKYSSANAGIMVNLVTGKATSISTNAGIGSDTIDGIENVVSGNFSDRIVGDVNNNILYGGGGDDAIDGGGGVNVAVYRGKLSSYVIIKNSDGSFKIKDNVSERDGTDTLKNINYIFFENQLYNLNLNPNGNLIAANSSAISTFFSSSVTVLQDALLSEQSLTGQALDVTAVDLNTLSIESLAALSTSQIIALTSDQISLLSTTTLRRLSTTQIAAFELSDFVILSSNQLSGFSSFQVTSLTTMELASLNSIQTLGLVTSAIASLSLDQLQAFNISNTRQLGAVTTAQIAGMSADYMGSFQSRLSDLTSRQINAITTSAIIGLGTSALSSLKSMQVGGLTTAQIVALTTAQVSSLNTAIINGLNSSQFRAIESVDIAALTTAQVQGLTSTQLSRLTSTQIRAIETTDIAALTTAQVQSLSSLVLNSFSSSQLQAITTINIAALTTAQVQSLYSFVLNGLSISQLQAIETIDIRALTTSQVQSLIPQALNGLTSSQFQSITASNIAALTTTQIVSLNTMPSVSWTKLLGGGQYDSAQSLIFDTDGKIYVAGNTQSNFDAQSKNGVLEDGFITQFLADGTKAWTRIFGGSGNELSHGLAAGTDGTIYIAGYSDGGIFDGNANIVQGDAFITRFNTDGTKVWTNFLGGNGNDAAISITAGNDGAIYVAGYTSSNLDGQINKGGLDAFVTRYNSDGTKAWTKLLGGNGNDAVLSLTAGTDGVIYAAGYTDSFSLDNQSHIGSYDAFITSYNSDGTKAWTKLLGGVDGDHANSLTLGTDGAIYVAGDTTSSFDDQTNNGGTDAFITRYNSDGSKSWTKFLGGSGNDVALSLITGIDGAIYVAGYTSSNLDGQINKGGLDAFVTRYNSDGTKAWTKLLGGSGNDQANSLTKGNDGSIYVAGYTQSSSFEGLNNNGNGDAFIVKIDSPNILVMTSTQINAFSSSQAIVLNTSQLSALTSTQVSGFTTNVIANFTLEQVSALRLLTTTQLKAITTAQIACATTTSIAVLDNAQLFSCLTSMQLSAITTSAITALGSSALSSLKSMQVGGLTSAQIVALTTAQVGSLSTSTINGFNSSQLRAFEAVDIAALSTAQVQTLTSAQLSRLSTSQVRAIETTDLATLSSSQLMGFNSAQVAALTVAELSSLNSIQTLGLGTSAIASLSLDQLQAFNISNTRQLSAVTTVQIAAMSAGYMGSFQSRLSDLTSMQINAITTSAITGLGSSALSSLKSMQVGGLTTAQIVALTTAQVSSLSAAIINGLTSGQLRAFEAVDIAALSTAQVQTLTSAQLSRLSTSQVRAIETTDLATLSSSQLMGLNSVQVVSLTTAELGSLNSIQTLGLGTSAIASLSLDQLQAFNISNTRQLSAVTTVQIAAMSAGYMGSFQSRLSDLTSMQINAITTSAITGLGSSALSSLKSMQVGGLTTAQIVALTTAQVSSLSAAIINGFNISQIRAIETVDIAALTTAQVQGLTSTQLSRLTTTQLRAIETIDIASLTTTQIQSLSSLTLNNLISSQLQAITTTDIAALTTTQIKSLGTHVLNSLNNSQLNSIESTDIAVLTTSQIRSLSSLVLNNLTMSQIQAITTTNIVSLSTSQLISLTSNSSSEWTILSGGAEYDWATNLSIAPDGGIYVAGVTTSYEFEGQVTNGSSDSFITRYNSDGTKLWTQILGGSGTDGVSSLSIGSDGAIYAIGYTNSRIFDSKVTNGGNDLFIARYDSDGTKAWSQILGGGDSYGTSKFSIGPDGAIYVAGATRVSVFEGETENFAIDSFISRYNSDGTKAWTKVLAGNEIDMISSLSIGSDGAIYAAGHTTSSVFDGQSTSNILGTNFSDIFVVRYNPDGTKAWTKILGGDGNEDINSLSISSDGSLYMAGYTSSSVFDGQFNNGGGGDSFIARYSSNGSKVWTKLIGGSDIDWTTGLSVDSDGSIYLMGFTSSINIDGQATNGEGDSFIARYNSDGTSAWTRVLGGNRFDLPVSLSIGRGGVICLTGFIDSGLNDSSLFDGQSISGGGDVFIASYNSDGTKAWTKVLGGNDYDYTSSISIGNDGAIYLVGYTNSRIFDSQTNSGFSNSFVAKISNPKILALTSLQIQALSSLQVATLTTTQLATLTSAQVLGFTTNAISNFTIDQVAALRSMATAQLAAITTMQIASATTSSIATLGNSQLFSNLSSTQISAITTSAITGLGSSALSSLKGLQVFGLTTVQIVALTTSQISSLSSVAINMFSSIQLRAIESIDIASLSTAQVQALTSTQLSQLTTMQLRAIETVDIAALTTLQVQNLNSLVLNNLSVSQLQAIETIDIAALTTLQIKNLSSFFINNLSISQLQAIETIDIAALTTSQIQSFGPIAINGLTGIQLQAITSTNIAALSTTQIASITSLPSITWSRLIGGSLNDEALALNIGANDEIYIAGYTAGSNFFDGEITNNNPYGSYIDSFVTRFNTDGSKVWTTILGGNGNDVAYGLTIDSYGEIYVVGYSDSIALDGQSNIGNNNDAFIARYSPDGIKMWTRLLGSVDNDQAIASTTGIDGAIYVAGYTTGNLDGLVNNGAGDAFVACYNSDGAKSWTQLLGGSRDDLANSLITGTDGSIYVAGYTFSSNFDGQVNNRGFDAFITRFNSDGTKIWTKLLGGNLVDGAKSLATTSDGGVYVAGYTTGSFDDQISNGSTDVFVTRYNSDGSKVWTRLLGGSGEDTATSLTVGTDGMIYVGGYTNSSFDGQNINGGFDAFVTCYSANGTEVWTKFLGGGGIDIGYSLASGNDGSIYMAGGTYNNFDSQTNNGNCDAFIVKLLPPNISAFTSVQLMALSSSQLSVLSSMQIASLSYSTTQLMAFTSSALVGFTTSQIQSIGNLKALTPIVLDLQDNGINTVSILDGTSFDLGNTGKVVKTGWIAGGDGLLVRDINGDRIINNGGELFGEGTVSATGQKAKNGYEAMQELDVNRDGILDKADAAFNELQVWRDNGDGITQSAELLSLTELGITSLSMTSQTSTVVDNGNLIGLMGSYTSEDGKTHTMGDVWFSVDNSGQKVFDLATVVEKSGGVSHVDLKAGEPATLNVALNDVLSLGEHDVNGLSTLKIDGDAGDTVQLAQGGDGWSQYGTVTEGEQSYDLYVNQEVQLLVNHKIHTVII